MRLAAVRISNYRNFKALDIDPFPTPAVIVGENGVGKSNLLNALRLVLDPDLPDRRRRLQPDDIHTGAPTLAEGVEVRVSVDIADIDGNTDALSLFDGAIVSTAPSVARFTYLFRPKRSLGVALGAPYSRELTPDDYEWTIFGARDPANAMLGAKRYAPLSVLPALRDAESDLTRSDNVLTRLLREMPPSTANLAAAISAMQDARRDLGRDPNVRKLRDMLRARVSTMGGPRIGVVPTLAFAGRSEDILKSVRIFIDLLATQGVDRTSTGTANVLYLALLLEHLDLRRGAANGEDTLLAVEEPEAHLHPTLQRNVFSHLLSRPSRLILTTHSPHIAAVTSLSSVLLASDTDHGTIARSVPPGVLTANQTADLQRYLNATRAEILFSRLTVFVEGAAEVHVVAAIARAAGFDLDAHGIVVASVEGTDFIPYSRLLSDAGLARRHLVLTDGDVAVADDPRNREPGLYRAAQLLELRSSPPQTFNKKLTGVAAGELDDGGQRTGRQALVEAAAAHGVYVGGYTLEVDLAAVFATEMTAAFEDLLASGTRRRNFSVAVSSAEASPEAEARKGVLSRVEKLGKGRYAQRLGGRIETVDLSA